MKVTRKLINWTPEGTPVFVPESEELRWIQQRDALSFYKEIKENHARVRKELRTEMGITESEMNKYLRKLYYTVHRALGKSDLRIQKELDMFERCQYRYYNNMEKQV